MAGYLFLLGGGGMEALERCIRTGVYSTFIKQPHGHWNTAYEATIGDYLSMKDGDNVYFFVNRKVYGVGTLINVGDSCKYKNYPLASMPTAHQYDDIRSDLLYDMGLNSETMRWLCTFMPYPAFFRDGVDMDDLLSSAPEKIRMIRTMQGVSFIKLDDQENKAVRDYIVFKNRNNLSSDEARYIFDDDVHQTIQQRVSAQYMLSAADIMDSCVNRDGTLGHEMALECGVIELLASGAPESDILGRWDYISHQVMASPFKPLVYADKMDIFGYNYMSGLPENYNTILDYVVLELKRDAANSDCVEQIIKYVEWIKQEYANGDYSRIKAFIIASDFDQSAFEACRISAVRHYTEGGRPPKTAVWDNLTLIKYRYNDVSKRLQLNQVFP
jgi:hypothetical protein